MHPPDPGRGDTLDDRPGHHRSVGAGHHSYGRQGALKLTQPRALLTRRRCAETVEHGEGEILKPRTPIDEQGFAQDPRKGPAVLRVLIAPAAEHGRQSVHYRLDPGPAKDRFGEVPAPVVAELLKVGETVEQIGQRHEVGAYLAIDPRRMDSAEL